jgi:hypothetical protein
VLRIGCPGPIAEIAFHRHSEVGPSVESLRSQSDGMRDASLDGRRFSFFACTTVVLILAVIPNADVLLGWDKSNHLLVFSVLTILGLRAYSQARIVGAGLLLYGIGIELLQAFLPYRSSEWSDVVADGLGIGLGIGTTRAVKRLTRRKKA